MTQPCWPYYRETEGAASHARRGCAPEIATLRWPGFCRRAHTLQRRPRDPQSLSERAMMRPTWPALAAMPLVLARPTCTGLWTLSHPFIRPSMRALSLLSIDMGLSFAPLHQHGLTCLHSSPSPSTWVHTPSVAVGLSFVRLHRHGLVFRPSPSTWTDLSLLFALFIDVDSVAPFPPTWARPASVDAGSFAASSVVVESSATALPLLSVFCSTERTQPSTCPKAVDLSESRRPVRRPSTCSEAVVPLTCPKAVDLSEGRRPVRCPKAVVPFTCPEVVVPPD